MPTISPHSKVRKANAQAEGKAMAGTYRIRPFALSDAERAAELFASYMAELYGQPNAMAPSVLRETEGRHFHLMLATTRADEPVGFAAWFDDYDLHNAAPGAEIADLYIERRHRGRGLSVRLVANIARLVGERGGSYVCGQALTEDDRRLRLVRRLTVGFPAETVYLSGHGMRRLASLADADLRTLVTRLPSANDSRKP